MIEQYRINSIDYKPSPIIALATSPNQSHVAAARDDSSLEIWLVSPGSVGWHCLLTIRGDPNRRITSLVWCRSGSGLGRLFSSRIDGSVSEWDLFSLSQKIVLESIGTSIWQMAVEPCENQRSDTENDSHSNGNGVVINGSVGENGGESSDSDVDDSGEFHEPSPAESCRLALACDDGCVRLYAISDSDELAYHKSLPRVNGRGLSLTWSLDGKFIYSGSSDGFIRCWDATYGRELYRITVGLGGLGTGNDLCVWSLLALGCGVLVSADSTGSVQFWDSQQGTLLDAFSYHKGDAYALAAAPSHKVVFSSGADGKVILYKLCSNANEASDKDNLSSEVARKWVYVDCKAAHSNDIRALAVAVPISREDLFPEEKVKRARRKKKPLDISYHKWAHLGVPMLLSGGDDTKIFAYSANEFLNYKPHDVCVVPQRVPVHMVQNSIFSKLPLLLVQASNRVDIFSLQLRNGMIGHKASVGAASTKLLVSVNSKASVKITCSAISPSGSLFSFSNNVKSSLFELKCSKDCKVSWSIIKKQLPGKLPSAHAMTFTSDSSRLIVAGHDRRIYVVDVGSAQMVHVFTPCRKTEDDVFQPSEPPITKLFTSSDRQWLASVNCFGDIYIFNMEIQKQHWFISRLDGASVTAGGFHPRSNNALVITTSSNLVYAFDVEAKKLGDWSKKNSFSLPRRFQEFPGEVIGLSFPPSPCSSSAIVYSSRAMCLINFGETMDKDDSRETISNEAIRGLDSLSKKLINSNGSLKRKLDQSDLGIKLYARKNFEISYFVNPVFFVGHLSERSVLVVDKPWKEVVKTLDNKPVHRHVYGS